MSSIANRSGGGVKLLDTVTSTQSSLAEKASNYFSTIGAGYDLLLVSVKTGSNGIARQVIPSEEYNDNGNWYFCVDYSSSTLTATIGKTSAKTQFSPPAYGSATFKIYGIRL